MMERFQQPAQNATDFQIFLEGIDGLSLELEDTGGEASTTLSSILRNSVIYLRHLLDNVGPKQPIKVLQHKFGHSDHICAKIDQLRTVYQYTSWRHIRGDGNCYYRAVLFGLIECLISSDRRRQLGDLAQRFDSVTFEAEEEQTQHTRLIQIVREAAASRAWMTIWEFEADMLRSECLLDKALIRAGRQLLGDFILKHVAQQFNGLELGVAIRANHEDMSLQQYVQGCILPLGTDIEGIVVNLGLLFEALGCSGRIVMLYSQVGVNVQVLEALHDARDDSAREAADVNLLFRPGHYDLIYYSRG
jgi:hypothetical protein